jgi:hypothetical protein
MAQMLQINSSVFEEARTLTSTADPVAFAPAAVTPMQPLVQAPLLPTVAPQPLPAWYLTPVAVIPVAAATFIIGNVLMMIPWSVF